MTLPAATADTARPDCTLTEFAFAPAQADQLLARLLHEISWQQEWAQVFGRRVPLPRLVAWHGEPGAVYRYSGLIHTPLAWTPLLSLLKARAEDLAATGFNSVLLNLYRNGEDAIGWHSDDEPELGPRPVIASLSFGATRRFRFKSRPPLPPLACEYTLTHGSCLVMRNDCQALWRHSIPRQRNIDTPRVNLTFRTIVATGAGPALSVRHE